ncbi:MAG: FAD-binding oxidoreductase [Bradyrhizobium sp.]|nr:FAD-binding oxidoreductase [Bradyrhizobium sp.]
MRQITGWGRYPIIATELLTPTNRTEVVRTMRAADGVVARGNGRAYGDAAVGTMSTLSMLGLDRMVRFDPEAGQLSAEAGVLLADVITAFLPLGFFPYVVPGTRYVTIGGAIASDVHGKNHHRERGFGDYVVDLTLLTGAGDIMRASPEENSDLFWATIGGMGLTGTILEATIRLRRVETGWIRQTTVVARDLATAMVALDAGDSSTYSIAWIDCVAKGAQLGRSLVFLGEHATRGELRGRSAENCFPSLGDPKLSVPIDLPSLALNPLSVAGFNELYFRAVARKAGAPFLSAALPYFFPLDGIANWNRIYGRRGFVQHQCVLPPATAARTLTEMLDRIARRGDGPFLAVLKKLGGSGGVLSFPFEGYTLALDFPFSLSLLEFLDELDRIVVNAGGRLYLSKDARQNRQTFEAGYPNAHRFRELRRSLDSAGRIRSHLSYRLGL